MLSLVDLDGQIFEEGVFMLDSVILAVCEVGVYFNLDFKNVFEEIFVVVIEWFDVVDQVIVIVYLVEDVVWLYMFNLNLVLFVLNDLEVLDVVGVNLDNVYLWFGVVEFDVVED